MGLVGCNFVCKNKDCDCFNKGFNLTGLWPVGDINILIEKCEDEALKQSLIRRKELGYECAKINYPDPYDIPVIGHSVEKYCENCRRIQTFIIKEWDSYDTPTKCHVCNQRYIEFIEACDEDNDIKIKCPYCKKDMAQNRWYVNDGLKKDINPEDEEEEETL